MKSRRLYYINRITNLFLENEAGRMKIEEIAAAVGVTKKTIYNYFDSKQELSECILDNYIRHQLNDVRTAIKDGLNPIATLLLLSETINRAYHDCYHLLTPMGKIRNTDSFVQVVETHQQELVEITEYTFKKGIRDGLFENDMDTQLASKLYITAIQMLSRSDSIVNTLLESEDKHKQVIFYMLKGACTPSGMQHLREMFDIKITLSHKLSDEASSEIGSIGRELRKHLQSRRPEDATQPQ
jgi:AcrR family transcriptional regulator